MSRQDLCSRLGQIILPVNQPCVILLPHSTQIVIRDCLRYQEFSLSDRSPSETGEASPVVGARLDIAFCPVPGASIGYIAYSYSILRASRRIPRVCSLTAKPNKQPSSVSWALLIFPRTTVS